ncbi:hypothetical protein MesoLj113b_68680 (plasmid) [Mesorhizobium sp. 113-3-3]|nr:hypothetical protein MesoLj113b_68680 [Mesorhizobium sp. 113-3-3]
MQTTGQIRCDEALQLWRAEGVDCSAVRQMAVTPTMAGIIILDARCGVAANGFRAGQSAGQPCSECPVECIPTPVVSTTPGSSQFLVSPSGPGIKATSVPASCRSK